MIALIAAPAFLHPRAPTAHAPRCSRLVACSEPPATTELKAAERSMDVGGYEAPLDKVTWKPFTYALPRARREAVRAYASNAARTLPPLPPLKIALIGPASSGKGTIAPMLSQAFRVRVVGVGQLLRSEQRAGTARAAAAAEAMAGGQLLPDELALEVLRDRLAGSADLARNGWLLDGFPRTAAQAEAVLHEPRWAALRPDCVVCLQRPDELLKEIALGRCFDAATGQTFHPKYAPPPAEAVEDLVWRVDDTPEVFERRLAEHAAAEVQVQKAFEDANVPWLSADNARSELGTFADIAAFLQSVAMQKLDVMVAELLSKGVEGAPSAPASDVKGTSLVDLALDVDRSAAYAALQARDLQPGTSGSVFTAATSQTQIDLIDSQWRYVHDGAVALQVQEAVARVAAASSVQLIDAREEDVAPYCDIDEEEAACVARYAAERERENEARGDGGDGGDGSESVAGTLLAAVRRCNAHDGRAYLPVLVGAKQVGWANAALLEALAPQLAAAGSLGHTCALIDVEPGANGLYRPRVGGGGGSGVGGGGSLGGSLGGGGVEGGVNVAATLPRPAAGTRAEGVWRGAQQATAGVQLAPEARSEAEATRLCAALVEELMGDGFIPEASKRGEEQQVRPLGANIGAKPLLSLERAAMIYLGVPAYAAHINGYVRDAASPDDPRPAAVWLARRASSKPTYPGLIDQMVAGGVSAGLSFTETMRKECEEEASLPPDVVSRVRPAGLVSYRYDTRKGLSTKLLAVYDAEMPQGLVPLCADGEVDGFVLMPIPELLASLRDELPLWKPNAALVAVDFVVRHGLVNVDDEPGYIELLHLLRAGGFG